MCLKDITKQYKKGKKIIGYKLFNYNRKRDNEILTGYFRRQYKEDCDFNYQLNKNYIAEKIELKTTAEIGSDKPYISGFHCFKNENDARDIFEEEKQVGGICLCKVEGMAAYEGLDSLGLKYYIVNGKIEHCDAYVLSEMKILEIIEIQE